MTAKRSDTEGGAGRVPAPTNSGRNPDGTFGPGNRVNPKGKPRGARHRVTRAIEALLQGEHASLTRKAVEMALAGDTVALRLCLDRLAPPRKDAPISFALPPVDDAAGMVAAGQAVLAALAAGDVTPDEAARVMGILQGQRALIETADLESRIAALEGGSE